MRKETASILNKYKQDQISLDAASRQLSVLFGHTKTATCMLNRLPAECTIIRHTSFKKCEGCGHFLK